MIDFSTWLLSHAAETSALGDLARDVRDDIDRDCLSAPFDAPELRQHLTEEHDASPAALDAVDVAELRYGTRR